MNKNKEERIMLEETRYNRRLVAAILASTMLGYYNLPLAVTAVEINQNNVPFKTNTTINTAGNLTNISTLTTNSDGNIGINTFGKFNVNNGDVVNLNLINQQNKLVNLIFDNNASQINGIINSYKDGVIGGNILFANPNGFVVGKTGVFNVGSLTMMTPTESIMKKIFDNNSINGQVLDNLISFTFKGDNYYLNGGSGNKTVLYPGKIEIGGKINSAGGIDLINGGQEITIKNGAELNANMDFTVSDGVVTAEKKSSVTPNTSEEVLKEGKENVKELKYTFAMNEGNGIVIASQNTAQERDYLSAIVNLDGKISANGGDVFAQTEIYNMDKKEDHSTSAINVKGNADISGHDITFNAKSNITSADKNVLDVSGSSSDWLNILNGTDILNNLADDFVHLGDVKTMVTIEDGAKINASNDVTIKSESILPISESSIMETFAFNFTDIDVLTESRVKSGAKITAGNNLNVQALTDFEMTNKTAASSIAEIIADVFHPFGHAGAYSLTISLVDLINSAVIEQCAQLDVNNDIAVNASMLRNYTGETKNGMIPVLDRNRGAAGIGIAVNVFSAKNEAIMNADTDIKGALTVNADYTGRVKHTVTATSASPGEDGNFGAVGKIAAAILGHGKLTAIFDKLGTSSKDRANATFGKIQIAGAINVAIDDAVNNAYIGSVENGIKPNIKANNVVVSSVLKDNKSQAYASAEADNGATSTSGAVVVNVRDMKSNADVYGDLTLTGSDADNSLIIRSKTDIQHGEATWDWIKETLIGWGIWKPTEVNPDLTSVNSANVDAYLAQYGLSDDYQKKIDDAGSKFSLTSMVNFNDGGLNGLFNTFASSQANAKSNNDKTNAWAGAVSVAITEATSNAILHDGSTVKILNNTGNDIKQNILVQSDSVSELWSGSVLMSLFNFKNLFGGMTARDGDATGGSLSIAYSDIDTKAEIGKNVKITAEENANTNIYVLANEDGEFINIGNGSSSADNSGIGGTFIVSAVTGGNSKAAIEEGAEIKGTNDITVKADRDDIFVNASFSFTNSQNSTSFAVSPLIVANNVSSYIAGIVNTSGNVNLEAIYDKLIVNTTVNAGAAKEGTDNPIFQDMTPDDDDGVMGDLDMLFDNMKAVPSVKDPSKYVKTDFNRPKNANKETAAYAGNIVTNVFLSEIEAYIKDGAEIKANDLKVNASSSDTIIDVGTVLAVNGKSGGGATVLFDMSKNSIEAYIGAATVDIVNKLDVLASENYSMIDIQAGIAQAKDKSGAGNLSVNLQLNDIQSGIKKGAKINENTDNENQSVNVDSKLTNKTLKVVGGVAIQAGGEEGKGGAIGASLDSNIYANKIKSYIDSAVVNAGKELNVTASNTASTIGIDVAGAASTGDSAYSGSLGTYISVNDIDSYILNSSINKTEGRTNKAADSKVKATSSYNEITVTGAFAGGKSNAAGGSVSSLVVSDDLSSYISGGHIETAGSLTLENKADIKSVAISVAGSVSTEANAVDGAIMAVIDGTTQNNYIENAQIDTGTLKLDSDNTFNAIGVTGVAAISLQDKAIGGSIYVSVIDNDINNYIKNSNVAAKNDITMTSDLNTDSLSIIFAGGGGNGVAASGAISTVVNSADVNTYILSENADKIMTSESGKIYIKSTNNTDIDTINGAISVSVGNNAIGAAINTVVDSSDVTAGIQGMTAQAGDNVEVGALSEENIMAISVGGAGGAGAAVSGSINTVVMASDTNAYIKNSYVTSANGDVKVSSSGISEITGGTGSAGISVGSAALGASIFTGVIDNDVSAVIEDSRVNAKRDVLVSSVAKETIGKKEAPVITLAGGFSMGLTVEGVINSLIMSSTANAHIKGAKTISDISGISAGRNVDIAATGEDNIYVAIGAAGVGTSAGVGATVNTMVIDKDTLAYAENTVIDANSDINAKAEENDNFFTTAVAAAGGGIAGVGGVVNTNVITSRVKSYYQNSTLKSGNNITADTDANAKMLTITGSAGAGGTAGIGLSAVNDIIKYTAESYLTGNAIFKELSLTADADSTYEYYTISGAGGGTAGLAGVENVNYVNNTVRAYANGVLTGIDDGYADKALVQASDKVTFKNPVAGTLAGGGFAGVGGTVMVNSITSTVQSYIGGNNIKINDIDVISSGEQNFKNIIAMGFAGGGTAAFSGTVLVNDVDTVVQSYVLNDSVILANTIDITADNNITLSSITGSGAGAGLAAVGASVNVNNFTATTESYTGSNVKMTAKDINVSAETTTSLGTNDNKIYIVAGAAGLYAGIAGSVLWNSIENKTAAYIGSNNTITLNDNGKLDLSAKDTSSIYETVGAGGAGVAGIGASVGGNEVHNTVLAYISAGSTVTGNNADVTINAESNETVDALGVVVGAGGVGLSGGAVYTNIGKKTANAAYNDIGDTEEQNTFAKSKTQSDDMKNKAAEKTTAANNSYQSGYNDALGRIKDTAKDTRIADEENGLKEVSESLYTKTGGSSIATTDRNGTTSAFVDTGVKLDVRNLKVNAQNTSDIGLETDGVAVGAGAIGVSVALAKDLTTTNAFISNNVQVNASSVEIKAKSTDDHDVESMAAVGGIIGGGGSHAEAVSDKTTNAYILKDTIINTKENIDVKTESNSVIDSYAKSGSFGGVAVGVSRAIAQSKGNAKIDIGENVQISSTNGNVNIKTDTNEKATAKAWAAAGGAGGGAGAVAYSETGKNNTVEIAKNFVADVKNLLNISSNAKNLSITESNGRAYGGIAGGGANGESVINQTSGVKIADASDIKIINAGSIDISSVVNNNAKSDVYAGAGALAGFSGSTAKTNIQSYVDNYMGKNYTITTNNSGYSIAADVLNEYKSYDKSDSFGVVIGAVPSIRNTISSTVKSVSEADIESAGSIIVAAKNEVKKDAVSGYDLYGGAGGIAGGSGGSILDNITMNSNAKLGGNKAYAHGAFGSGDVTVGTYNIANINEKADLYAHGGIMGADTDSIVRLNIDAKTEITNKDIRNYDDNINFAARNDIDIYTKSSIESYGGLTGTGGTSEAKTNRQYADIVIADGAKSVSGRDTNVSAISNKSLESYIYERTRGLVSVISGHANAYNDDSKSTITINSGSALKSYDAMNLTAQSSAQKIKATRDAIAYQLWGIPYKGKGNTDTSNNNNAGIVLNGSTESGLGANKSLTINNDGTYTADGVNVRGLEKVGEITSAEIQIDIDSYKESLKTAKTEYDTYILSLNQASAAYEQAKGTAETNKATYEANNEILTTNKNTAQSTLTSITNAINNVANIGSTSYQTTYGSIAEVQALITAYKNAGNKAEGTAYTNAYNALTAKQTSLTNQISGYETQIQTNNNSIATCEAAITANQLKIDEIAQKKIDVQNMYTQQTNVIQGYIDDLQAQKTELDSTGSTTPVYSMVIDDIIVRSGETNVTGNVTGTGSITAPGNKFTITVDNNSVNSVVYHDLILGRNLKGGIYGDSIASSITKTIKNPEDLYKISVTNYIDANDPTINFTGNAGDIVLQGNIENVKGAFDLTNYTGNVLSQGSLTARDIHIKVPNGSMTQQYNVNEYKIGGNTGESAIVAARDIDISSKIINVNGLIQSGSEIKQVTIPEFSVIKKDDGYYQVVNGVETYMKPSEMTKGYYYLTLTDDKSDLASIQQIKAYFKPSDTDETNNIPGEIHLFKADIDGGNITLTGNIVNDKETGKIVLINGYGHIDVTNNSNYNLVTSALNADTNIKGKLTINDFKVGYNEPEYSTGLLGVPIKVKEGGPNYEEYEAIKHSDLTNEFISSHAGTYTAYVDEGGNIITTADGVTDGNGSWSGSQSNSTNSFGANVYSTTYTPGQDAYSIENEGELRSYTVYVKRSWWTELWYGKLYETRYYTTAPTYGVKANPIAVNFQGFSAPQINVTSNGTGNVIMNNNISALAGDVKITTGGNLLTNTVNNIISAKNITLNAAGNIGQEVISGSVYRPIQTSIFDDGKLSAKGKDVYINFPYAGIGNIDINANDGAGNIYLSASEGNFNGAGKTVGIKADSLDLRADYINLDTSENENINIDIKKLKATAKDDISITNKSHLKLSSIISENQGTITIVSKEGSIIANEDTGTYSPYHINGGDVILKAVNGLIATSENNLKFANKGTFYVQAKGDVYLDSASAIYADLIESTQGALTVNADLGIIASYITDENRVYNLASKNDMNLTARTGNIENITINTDGTVNAIAGYDTNGAVSGVNDIKITLASQIIPTGDNITDEQRTLFAATAKDLNIGTIKASQNVTMSSEKGIKNANSSSFVAGERIALNAVGDIGEETSAIDLTANREVTVISSAGSNVYLKTSDTEKGLKINTIDSSSDSALAKVVITSAGNVTNNAEKSENNETINIKADNVSITTTKDIGEFENELTVQTASSDISKGLSFSAIKAFIKGLGEKLNIIKGDTSDTLAVNSVDTAISANNITSAKEVTLTSNADIATDNIIVNNDEALNITSSAKTTLSNSNAKEINVKSNDALLTGTIKSDIVSVETSNNSEIKNAVLSYLTDGSNSKLSVVSSGIDIDNSTVKSVNSFTAAKDINVNDTSFTNDLNIINSNNTIVTGKLEADKDVNITSVNNITIADANIKQNLNVVSKNTNISEIALGDNINANVDNLNVNTSNDIHLGTIKGNTSQYSDNVVIDSKQNITNGLSDNSKNLYVSNADLKAENSIGTNDKNIVLNVADNNSVIMNAQNSVNVDSSGAKINYTNLNASEVNLLAENGINILDLKTDNIKINTSSTDVSIIGSVGTKGDIRTADKHIVIDNTSLEPHLEADVQLYLSQQPIHLGIDKTNNVKIESVNVTRYGDRIKINGVKNSYSMESEIIASTVSTINNSKSIISDNIKDVLRLQDSGYIDKIINDEQVLILNTKDIVNLDENSKLNTDINKLLIQDEQMPKPTLRQLKKKLKFKHKDKKSNFIGRAK